MSSSYWIFLALTNLLAGRESLDFEGSGAPGFDLTTTTTVRPAPKRVPSALTEVHQLDVSRPKGETPVMMGSDG